MTIMGTDVLGLLSRVLDHDIITSRLSFQYAGQLAVTIACSKWACCQLMKD